MCPTFEIRILWPESKSDRLCIQEAMFWLKPQCIIITNIDYTSIWDGIKTYAKKVGRVAARPVLLLYYVMKSEETPMKDKLTIFGALAYVVLPIDLISAKRLPIIGWIDEVVSLAVAVQRMQKYITPRHGTESRRTLGQVIPRIYPTRRGDCVKEPRQHKSAQPIWVEKDTAL